MASDNAPNDTEGHASERRTEWFDNVDIWDLAYPIFFSEAKFRQALEEINPILTLADASGTTVLDLCSGPGRFAIPLAERGFHVTAVDNSRFLMDKAKERAREAGVGIDFVLKDMRDFVRPDTFDLALNMFTSFGYFENRNEDDQVLRNVFDSLRPGGVFVVDLFGKEIIAARFIETSRVQIDDGAYLFENRRVIDDWTRVAVTWTVVADGQVRAFESTVRSYSGAELRDAMFRAGFAEVSLFGNVAGIPYDRQAERLIAVARKAA